MVNVAGEKPDDYNVIIGRLSPTKNDRQGDIGIAIELMIPLFWFTR